MKYFPFENINYQTKLSREEVVDRIFEIIEPKNNLRISLFFGSNDHKPYEGKIEGKSFNMVRIIGYRNSFLPRIKGVIEEDINGTKINVEMTLHPFVIVFIFLWLAIVGYFGFSIIFSVSNKESFDFFNLLPFTMIIFLYAMVMGGFKYESIKSKKYFAELFEAEII